MSDLVQEIKCQNCGSNIHLDLDNLVSKCPSCGSSIMIDVNQLASIQDFLIKKEDVKRDIAAMEYKEKSEEQDKEVIIKLIMMSGKYMLFSLIVIAIVALFCFLEKFLSIT